MKNPNASQTENQKSRAERFTELDARIKQSLADIEDAAAEIAGNEWPPDYVDAPGFKQFIESQKITLTSEDEDGLSVLAVFFGAAKFLPPETILDTLRRFNPARQPKASA